MLSSKLSCLRHHHVFRTLRRDNHVGLVDARGLTNGIISEVETRKWRRAPWAETLIEHENDRAIARERRVDLATECCAMKREVQYELTSLYQLL